MVSMGTAIIGLAVGFFLLYDIQQERTPVSPESLNQLLAESNQRLDTVKRDFYNGQYNGDIPIKEAINLIESEIKTQEDILSEYKGLPDELKTDRTIDMKFWQLGKYSWAGEKSMLEALKKQIP